MNEKAIETMSSEDLLAERQKMVERVLERDAKGCESGSHVDNSRGSAEWQEAAARFREIDNLIFERNN
ncbi:MAG: hypothetical protein U9R20_04285 [Thermodesulfobacteriota bacterium]|nr:hypothetical protein [Thermodesulfobacteriota bacterium]